MVNKIAIFESQSNDVFYNQAVELTLFENVEDNEIILYLWTNDNTVVIGANQDAYAECKIKELESDGGKLARRLSGGGAVYHDIGNVNFTFIGKEDVFSLDDNRKVLYDALKSLGFNPSFTGRNDLEIEGYKVSGNAYYKRNGIRYHHGTMLISSSPEKVAKYLTPALAKFANKKVKSVESRVTCLKTFNSDIEKSDFVKAIKDSFVNMYSNATLKKAVIDEEKIKSNQEFFGSDKWRLNDTNYNLRIPYVLDGENVVVALKIEDGTIKNCDVFSDSMCYNKIVLDKLVNTNFKEANGELIDYIKEKWYEL